jgi:hypothetical protein
VKLDEAGWAVVTASLGGALEEATCGNHFERVAAKIALGIARPFALASAAIESGETVGKVAVPLSPDIVVEPFAFERVPLDVLRHLLVWAARCGFFGWELLQLRLVSRMWLRACDSQPVVRAWRAINCDYVVWEVRTCRWQPDWSTPACDVLRMLMFGEAKGSSDDSGRFVAALLGVVRGSGVVAAAQPSAGLALEA